MDDSPQLRRLAMLEKRIADGAQDPFLFYARALELRSLGELTRTLEALTEVAKRFSDYVPTYLMAGQVAAELDELDVARDFLQRGLELSEKVGDHHANSEIQAALEAL